VKFRGVAPRMLRFSDFPIFRFFDFQAPFPQYSRVLERSRRRALPRWRCRRIRRARNEERKLKTLRGLKARIRDPGDRTLGRNSLATIFQASPSRRGSTSFRELSFLPTETHKRACRGCALKGSEKIFPLSTFIPRSCKGVRRNAALSSKAPSFFTAAISN